MQEHLWFEHIFDNDDNVDKDNNLIMLLRRNQKDILYLCLSAELAH